MAKNTKTLWGTCLMALVHFHRGKRYHKVTQEEVNRLVFDVSMVLVEGQLFENAITEVLGNPPWREEIPF